MSTLVADPTDVAAIAEAIARAPLVAFDLEFLAQDRLVPTLCLVQVAWLSADVSLDAPAEAVVAAPPEIALVDPLAADARPVIDALASHRTVIAHAARQDLQLLAARFGATIPGIVDTQVMAAFAGIGDQIGLAPLARELLGASLGKELQWTDWAQRPLTPAQLAYAHADVRHLAAIYAMLADRLGGRLAWARDESAVVAADALAAARVTPETAWRQLGGTRGLDATGFAAVVALAAWRHRTAMELDRPLGQVLSDRSLLELARQRPGAPEGVRALKGIAPIARQRAGAILAAIAEAPAVEWAPPPAWRPASARAQRWAEVLLAIVQLVADQTGVAARLLATRADAEELARAVDERGLDAALDLPALATWRRDVLGQAWLGWLDGSLALVGDRTAPSGLALVPR